MYLPGFSLHMHRRKTQSAPISECVVAFLISALSIQLFQFHQANYVSAQTGNSCPPSSCGKISEIKYPFRLKGDPESCGDPRYELTCENNNNLTTTLTLSLLSGEYHVESINYNNFTIRLVDPAVQQLHHQDSNFSCASIPRYTLYPNNFSNIPDENNPYNVYQMQGSDFYVDNVQIATGMVYFWHCNSIPMSNTLSVNTTPCSDSDGSYSSELLYVTVNDFNFDVGCQVKRVIFTSMNIANVSGSNVQKALEFGFEVSWLDGVCINHCRSQYCHLDQSNSSTALQCDPFPVGVRFCHYTEWTTYLCDAGFFTKLKTFIKALLDVIAKVTTALYWLLRLQPSRADFPDQPSPEKLTGQVILPSYFGARLLFGIVLLTILLIYRCRRRHLSVYESIETFLSHNNDLMPVRYSHKEIKRMTRGFKDKLGEGGYGCVYKGKLRSGPLVAVKVLTKSKASTGEEFINEVATIGRIHHVNVVKLIGFCVERSKRALVYEFMPNGSLDKHIFSKQGHGTDDLSCDKMYSISLGVARGIAYLHEGCDMQILHFDIKPHNILLDENFVPKVSDFGLARLYAIDDSIVSVTARGTLGYMAPELYYKNIGGVSYKADVYSFGMLLMEMASRRKNMDMLTAEDGLISGDNLSQMYFPTWVHDQFTVGEDIELEDIVTEEEKIVATKMIMVALWCIQMNPKERPSMRKVVEMLEGDLQSIEMPPRPNLFPQANPVFNESSAYTSNQEESISYSEDATDSSWEVTSTTAVSS